ncbi:aminoacyl-tRNA hydrolase [Helicobacter sp. 16-1353]|uniref:aminoacyl-tRNA hydrolase n=1 Tax=Helicobacter sp. 16-1353 TaxID=2004996 RepID=UPI000DCE94F9|nr:aminoacyl-tRNA hydrolase [Helicobacter sp. 16-1353]RAX54366.1 aminoacyl-tRNA hydrolase [Helicobacter sp. 16-1353]
MKLVVGLGNPGAKYQYTRHNIGFMALDYYIQDASFKLPFINDKKFQSQIIKTNNAIFIKPQTYMNLSGVALKAVKDFYKIEQIMVIHDDLDLALGAIRLKFGGGSGGHNGLKSIDEYITKDYLRLRIGIGRPPKNTQDSTNIENIIQKDVIDYVLEKFSTNELESLQNIFEITKNAIESFINDESLMSLQNKYTRNVI